MCYPGASKMFQVSEESNETEGNTWRRVALICLMLIFSAKRRGSIHRRDIRVSLEEET